VLFELIGSRYERLSLLIYQSVVRRAGQGVPRPSHDARAINHLVYHAAILEMNVESYSRRAAINRKRGPGRFSSRLSLCCRNEVTL
jgi:hypothetical protein